MESWEMWHLLMVRKTHKEELTPVVLGIDTSNYKTSVAAIDPEGIIVCNYQQLLEVKKGERGLRQSTALFQHVNQLPVLMERVQQVLSDRYSIAGVSVSNRPRPVEGSYMPVFQAGVSTARSIAAALDVPVLQFSHQEGHIEAVKHYSCMKETERLICFHFSGGTSEALLVDCGTISLIGGSKDISFGQVLDRLGVTLGMAFPCGEEMDQIAQKHGIIEKNALPKIRCQEGYINLSGIETKCQRSVGTLPKEALISMTFHRIAQAMESICIELAEKYQIQDFLFAGGVSSSKFIRQYLQERLPQFHICFGEPELSTDNAVGIALLGGHEIWR